MVGVQNRQGEGKNSMGNGEAKELICRTHGHELRWRNDGRGGIGQRGIKGRKKWDNCHSINHKIYLTKEINSIEVNIQGQYVYNTHL